MDISDILNRMNFGSEEEKKLADFLNKPSGEILEWKDYAPGQKPYYDLRLLSDREVCALGEATFDALHTRVTRRSVVNLLVLAFQLTDSAGQRLFEEALPVEVANPNLCKEFSKVPDIALQTVATARTDYRILIPRSHPDYTQKMSTAFCFWATSLLRLFTMTPENYTQTANHLAARFKLFYNYPFPIHNHAITRDAASSVKISFGSQSNQHTFYILLVAGEKRVTGDDIKQFLYKTNISYSGLHCFLLFRKITEGYGVSNATLINVLSDGNIRSKLRTIAHVLKNLCDTNLPGYQLQMWRYARIFEHRFLLSLQTKNCVYFTAVLAYMLHELGSTGELNIFHLRELGEASRDAARDHALRAVQLIAKSQS